MKFAPSLMKTSNFQRTSGTDFTLFWAAVESQCVLRPKLYALNQRSVLLLILQKYQYNLAEE